MAKRFVLASSIGVFATLALLALAFFAASTGHESLAEVLFWQNSVFQRLSPCGNIGTVEHPICEATALNFLAFGVSVLVGFLVYGFVAYALIGSSQRRA